jgi:hypothetical protein
LKPTRELNWIKGLRAGYKSIGAAQSEQYSWMARTADSFVFNAEIDHIDPVNNCFDFTKGEFHKTVPPLSTSKGDHGLRVRHAQELLDAVTRAYREQLTCRLLLLRGTKYGTTKGGIHAAVDPGSWSVSEVSGDVETGFQFRLVRFERCAVSDSS